MKSPTNNGRKSAVIACLLAALGLSANAQLLHRYDFASDANDSVGTANGTLEGTSTITGGALVTSSQISGQWSSGAPLNGVMLPGTAVAGITGPFTIETWFQAASSSDWPKFQTTFSFSDGTTANYVLATPVRGYWPWASSVAVIGGGGNSSEQLAQGIYLDTPAVHQQLVTYDGTTVSYYIDGALANFSDLAATFTDVGLNLSTLTDIGVGGGSPWPDNALHGQTFDFRIYGQSLTAGQVAGIYGLGADATTAEIVSIVVPEPSILALMALGLLARVAVARRLSAMTPR